jgi:hypothetical protein
MSLAWGEARVEEGLLLAHSLPDVFVATPFLFEELATDWAVHGLSMGAQHVLDHDCYAFQRVARQATHVL